MNNSLVFKSLISAAVAIAIVAYVQSSKAQTIPSAPANGTTAVAQKI